MVECAYDVYVCVCVCLCVCVCVCVWLNVSASAQPDLHLSGSISVGGGCKTGMCFVGTVADLELRIKILCPDSLQRRSSDARWMFINSFGEICSELHIFFG